MNNIIKQFVDLKNDIKSYFNCEDDYFLKIITDFNWKIKNQDDIYILTYWKDDESIKECVIVKKGNSPLIYEGKDYTMIIAIECVKIGLIVKNI